MRIISKFHDYYDSIGGPPDKGDRTWVRTTSKLTLQAGEVAAKARVLLDLVDQMPGPPYPYEYEAERVAVAFCGRAYGFMLWQGEAPGWSSTEVRSYRSTYPWTKRGWERWEEEWSGKELGDEFHRELDSPVIQVTVPSFWHYGWTKGHVELTVNPCLRDLGFVRLVDPYTAWQEVDMYLGNQLAKQENPNTAISDEDMRDMKGFDGRSFKRDPGTHPNRKRKKKK